MRLRRLLWLIALAVFVCPSWIGSAAAADRIAHPIAGHCHDVPPPPCPEHGSAKHAAGLCCPLMSQSAAVMPRAMVLNPSRDPSRFVLAAGPHLTGLSPHEDPPPPRV
jgi:hypothetical protein